MIAFRQVQELYHSYMVTNHNPDIAETDYGYNMIMHQNIPYLAVFQNRSQDQNAEYYYDITSYTSLKDLSHKKINEKIIDCLVYSLCGVMESMEDYLLDCNDMVLDVSSVFYNENGQFQFIYYPGYQKDFVEQLKVMSEQILTTIDYTSDSCVRKAYKLYDLACDNHHALKRLKSFFFGDEPIKEIVVEPEIIALPEIQEKEEKKVKKIPIWLWPILVFEDVLICFVAFFVMRLWLFNDYLISTICAAGIMAILVVTEIIVIRNKYGDVEKDFWQPEDYINMEGVTGWTENTEIRFNSVHKERWPDMIIKQFPAIVGKNSKDPACCIRLPMISGKHAQLDKREDGIYITDMDSANGTFVNGEMLTPRQAIRLNAKDSVIFADVEFIFESMAKK